MRVLPALVVVAIACVLLLMRVDAAGGTTRASLSSEGAQANADSVLPLISGDGRYVVFRSIATNLVAGDTNATTDVFLHDRATGLMVRVSVSSDGEEGNDDSLFPSINGDGRYVAFKSWASNFVPGDANGRADIFLRDLQTGVTTLVSAGSDGTQGNDESGTPSISADGRYVAFASLSTNLVSGDTNGEQDIFVRDLQTGATTRVNLTDDGAQANGQSFSPAISADARYVAFESAATNLVPGDTNGERDVFARDRQTGATTRVSVSSDGAEGNGRSGSFGIAISADGRYVAFQSDASNLVPGDTNDATDVFIHDRQTGVIMRVSVASDGTEANGRSTVPSISADGRYVAFDSDASNLVPGDTNGARDVFVHELQTGTTERVSVAADGAQASGFSAFPSISADGLSVAFDSEASNLVPGDSNGERDIFVRDRKPAVLFGDASCDALVNAIDAALVLQVTAGLVASPPCADAADVNQDGVVNSLDAAIILQFTAGLVPRLPV